MQTAAFQAHEGRLAGQEMDLWLGARKLRRAHLQLAYLQCLGYCPLGFEWGETGNQIPDADAPNAFCRPQRCKTTVGNAFEQLAVPK